MLGFRHWSGASSTDVNDRIKTALEGLSSIPKQVAPLLRALPEAAKPVLTFVIGRADASHPAFPREAPSVRVSLVLGLFVVFATAQASGAKAFPDGATSYQDLALKEGRCSANCITVHDNGRQRWWYSVDGDGALHLDFAETRAEGEGALHTVVVYSSERPVVAERRPADRRCGVDGWGWERGEPILALDYGNFRVLTKYSHAGQAVRVSVDKASGRLIGTADGVASGVREGAPSDCADVRSAVMGP